MDGENETPGIYPLYLSMLRHELYIFLPCPALCSHTCCCLHLNPGSSLSAVGKCHLLVDFPGVR